MASTETMTYQPSLDSQYLSSSLSNLSRSRSTNSLIVRTYKQATQLYLTKRFKEALDTLNPIISSPSSPEQNGEVDEDKTHVPSGAAAPIAQSSKGTRTKVWVFYLSLLHAIIDLGTEEGKVQFGSSTWREIVAKARDGTVWEEMIHRGYGGREGDVDADVVANLATLLLGHMSTQRLNQQRLEAWLSASADAPGGRHVQYADGTMSPLPDGSLTPKVLASRQRILELYALHVLPANEEWTYAKEFIEMNESLDEERKEAFSHALQQLREEKDGTVKRDRELAEQREREMEQQRRAEEVQQAEEARQEEERRKAAEAERLKATNAHSAPTMAANGHAKPAANGHARPTPQSTPRPISKAPKQPSPPPPSPANMYRRASSLLNNLQQMIMRASRQMAAGNPMALFRFWMFMLAFLVIIARRDVRLKVKRILEDGWIKVKKTIGMGVKVSYI